MVPGLPAVEFKIWKSIYEVLRLPDHRQRYAVCRLCEWSQDWWAEHRGDAIEGRVLALETLAIAKEGGDM